jgi:hypothetical protein
MISYKIVCTVVEHGCLQALWIALNKLPNAGISAKREWRHERTNYSEFLADCPTHLSAVLIEQTASRALTRARKAS